MPINYKPNHINVDSERIDLASWQLSNRNFAELLGENFSDSSVINELDVSSNNITNISSAINSIKIKTLNICDNPIFFEAILKLIQKAKIEQILYTYKGTSTGQILNSLKLKENYRIINVREAINNGTYGEIFKVYIDKYHPDVFAINEKLSPNSEPGVCSTQIMFKLV